MNSDFQVTVKTPEGKSSALSYHHFVDTLVKKFPTMGVQDVIDDPMKAVKMIADYAQKLTYCHLALGLVTEAAETADILKSHAVYGKELDRAALVKELGDMRFWVQDAQNKFHISDHEISQGNADKLSERYGKMMYSDRDAIARVDKKFFVGRVNPLTDRVEIASNFYEHLYEVERLCQGSPLFSIYEQTPEGLKKVS